MDTPQPTVPDRSREREKSLKMVCGSFYIPKQDYSKPQGDDAHLICVENQTIGVADGVGGWSRKGVDAGQYARELIANSLKAIQNEVKGEVDPRRVIDEAYSNTNVEGSSTVCILTLKNNKLHAANVGDSGFMLIRDGKDVYKSLIQQHSFNLPYQLGNDTSSDRPSSAQTYNVPVQSGDVIVMGTDGLFDNVFGNNIVDVAKMVFDNGAEPEQVAWAIAEHAYHNSLDKSAATPYTEASLMAGKERMGGKPDDITVIVAYIVEK